LTKGGGSIVVSWLSFYREIIGFVVVVVGCTVNVRVADSRFALVIASSMFGSGESWRRSVHEFESGLIAQSVSSSGTSEFFVIALSTQLIFAFLQLNMREERARERA
jgi:hypothetical protein